MRTIYKYTIQPEEGPFKIMIPEGATVLCAQAQHGEVCVWAEVQTENGPAPRYFEVFGTGHRIPLGKRKYLGTVQLEEGSLVFHVYELIP